MQPIHLVYDVEKVIRFSEKAGAPGKPILVEIMPLKSVKMARCMQETVEGIDVPEAIISRMETDGKSGTDIACDIIREIRP